MTWRSRLHNWTVRKRLRMRLAVAREWCLHVLWYSWVGWLAEWWEYQLAGAFATGGVLGPEPERAYYRVGEVPCQLERPVLYLSVPVPADMLPPGAIIATPFPLWAQKALRAWQACPWAHPLTCTCGGGQALEVRHYGLECRACGYVQNRVPALCLQLPPDPAVLLQQAVSSVPGA